MRGAFSRVFPHAESSPCVPIEAPPSPSLRSMSQTDGSLPSLGSFSSRSLQRESSFVRVKHHSGADTVGTGAGVREGDSGDWWLTR